MKSVTWGNVEPGSTFLVMQHPAVERHHLCKHLPDGLGCGVIVKFVLVTSLEMHKQGVERIPLTHRRRPKTTLLATSVRRSQYHCIIPWMFSHSWSGSCFMVRNGLECLCLQHTQSKWPFGKASRVIIVNYSVKLRGLLRGNRASGRFSAPLMWGLPYH